MADQLGFLECPECSGEAKYMADKRKFVYLDCGCCGIFKYQRHTGQSQLKKRFAVSGRPLGEAAPVLAPAQSEPQPEPVQKPEPKPAPSPEPKPQKTSLLGNFLRRKPNA